MKQSEGRRVRVFAATQRYPLTPEAPLAWVIASRVGDRLVANPVLAPRRLAGQRDRPSSGPPAAAPESLADSALCAWSDQQHGHQACGGAEQEAATEGDAPMHDDPGQDVRGAPIDRSAAAAVGCAVQMRLVSVPQYNPIRTPALLQARSSALAICRLISRVPRGRAETVASARCAAG
jgi:hypothetical protein